MTTTNRFVLLLVATALLLATSGSAAQAWPGANGEIVFEAFVPGGGEEPGRGAGLRIARLGAPSSEIRSLTADPPDRAPQVSPDGRRVVFMRGSGTEAGTSGPSTLYVINTDGSDLRPITDGLHTDADPAFSASGARVYFTRRVPGQGTDVFSVRLDGTGLRRITSGGASDHHPRMAPGGFVIAFERRVVSGSSVRYQHVFTARVDGSRVRDLTPKLPRALAATDPEFSPNGRRVAYSTGDRLLSVRADGTGPRLLIKARAGSDDTYADPSFAPDGRSLLFTAIDFSSGHSSLQRLDLRSLHRLPSPLAEPRIGVRSPAWLPVPPRG
jgi:Tol biopolymer transport system component